MLKINLLPESVRPTSLSRVEQFHRTPLLWIIFAIALFLPSWYWAVASGNQRQLDALSATLDVLEPRQATVDQLQRKLRQLLAQEAAFRQMKPGEGGWARRLQSLGDATPEGVWYTELLLDQMKGLVIQGASVGAGGPTKLVEELKQDKDFMSAVKAVQIESLKTVAEGDLEVVQFTLSCALHEASASP